MDGPVVGGRRGGRRLDKIGGKRKRDKWKLNEKQKENKIENGIEEVEIAEMRLLECKGNESGRRNPKEISGMSAIGCLIKRFRGSE